MLMLLLLTLFFNVHFSFKFSLKIFIYVNHSNKIVFASFRKKYTTTVPSITATAATAMRTALSQAEGGLLEPMMALEVGISALYICILAGLSIEKFVCFKE